QAGPSIVGAMRRWVSLAMLLFAAVVVLPALANASPPDPSWVAGFWDEGDFDDVVLGVTGITAAPHIRPGAVPCPSLCVVWVARPPMIFFFRAKKLPELFRSLGQALAQFKKGLAESNDEARASDAVTPAPKAAAAHDPSQRPDGSV